MSKLRPFLLLIWVLLASMLAGAAVAQETFSLEQIMSSPFPSELTAAPAGGSVAWVLNARGARNIWVAEPPDYRGRQLTSYTEDDGQEITELAWSPDGLAVVFVRGGEANRQGEYPNPTSDAEGVEQAVWVVSLEGGAPKKLGEGHSPAVSPTAGRVAFLRKDQVWWAPLDAGGKAEQLIKARGEAHSLRWSPDGAQLAFVSGRGDHSFIGVYDVARKSLRFLDPSPDRDSNPAWSPDGKEIAFLRIPASRWLFTFGPKREAEPWSLRVADAATGKGREIWRAEKGRGSVFRAVVAENQLLWVAGDWLVFPWERTGWTLLYSVPAKGGQAALLTPGEFEVEHVSLDAFQKNIIFSSNQGDVDRRHLWRVTLRGERPVAVTSGTGIEWSPVAASDGGAIAFLASDARTPAHAAVLKAGQSMAQELAPGTLPTDFPVNSLAAPQQVIYSAADGMKIHAQLFLPGNVRAGERRPAVIFFHGGSRRQMLLGWHYMEYYHNAYALNQFLASRGYVVLSANYRSGIGYGMEFREALNYGAHGASEFNDVLGAGLYLRSRPDVNPDRIGLWGGSYGGYLTALGLARASELFAAGVDIHGVHDWNQVIRNFEPTYDPAKRAEEARRAFESSPLASVKNWRSPVLLIHGDDDRNVPFSESVDLVESLREQGVHFEEVIFPDDVHDFLLHRNWLAAYGAAAGFFDRFLRRTGN